MGFQAQNVWSISTSGHKYGLVYPGVGWVIWRSKEALPEECLLGKLPWWQKHGD